MTGYEVQKLREELDQRSNQNKQLEVELMTAASLNHIEEKVKQVRFEVPSKDRVVFMFTPAKQASLWDSCVSSLFKWRTAKEFKSKGPGKF